MEVHHHSHTSRKKWTHYFWEFLMLFLAVFCGFLAEYQLEHKIEKDREKQYLVSLVSDLKDDSHSIQDLMTTERSRIKELDTLMKLLNNPDLARQSGDQLYFVARMGPRSNPFGSNTRTFDQLKNSGGFRLIRNVEISNRIASYYGQFSTLRLLEDNYNNEFNNYKLVAGRILDPAVLRSAEQDDGTIVRTEINPALQTYEPVSLKQLAFHALQMNGSRRGKLVLLEILKKTADELIAYISGD